MVLGNIVSNNNISVSEEFNVVKTMDEIIHGLPTLIVGYDLVNKLYPDFDITNILVNGDIYWTFKKTEKRDKYEEDLAWFTSKVYKNLTDNIPYIFIDPIQDKPKKLKKIIKKIHTIKNIITFIDVDMVYIYGENMIFGVDLKLLDYIGFNVDKIKLKIKKISSVFLDNKEILIEYKNTLETLDNKVRYVPLIYSIRHEQNNSSSVIHIPRES
jgi:hypothetical protein